MDESRRSLFCEYKRILSKVHACNSIKYAAYRTASKLRVLQSCLCFSNVPVRIIKGVLEHHQVFATDNSLTLQKKEIEAILHDIYFAANKGESEKTELSVQLMLMLLNSIYDRNETGSVSVLNIKVFLISICGSPLQLKYQYWFSELADHNLCLRKRHLQSLLESLIAIVDYISEGNTFSRNLIDPTLNSCYAKDYSLGINEVQFMNWVLKEPQLLVWLSTFYRICAAESVTHSVSCSVCHVSPIIGLRYHCLRCICYDLCQSCFFTARANKRHKTSHMIQEYCTEISSYETAIACLKGLLNRFCGSPSKLQYLPAHQAAQTIDSKRLTESEEDCSTNVEKCITEFIDGENLNDSIKQKSVNQLQAVISKIENEVKLLKQAVGKDGSGTLINQHTQYLQEQMNQLYLVQKETMESGSCVVSTPMVGHGAYNDFELSAITVHSEGAWQDTSPSGFSTWLQNMDAEKTYNRQLHADLDHILNKLHSMLETNFVDYESSHSSQSNIAPINRLNDNNSPSTSEKSRGNPEKPNIDL